MLTYIMSSTVKTFTMPKSLDSQLASVDDHKTNAAPEQDRSEKNAEETAQSFPQEEKNPLANHKSVESKPGITFAAQDKLPKLPIPDLEQTCKKYLDALDPLQTLREHRDSERAAQEFMKTDGPELQEKLKKYASGKSSYIEQFCKWLCTFRGKGNGVRRY